LHPNNWWLIIVDLGRRLVPVSDWWRLVHIINRRSSRAVGLWWWLIVYFRGLWDGTFCGNVTGTSQRGSGNIVVRHFWS
jgi:hypothetical protein